MPKDFLKHPLPGLAGSRRVRRGRPMRPCGGSTGPRWNAMERGPQVCTRGLIRSGDYADCQCRVPKGFARSHWNGTRGTRWNAFHIIARGGSLRSGIALVCAHGSLVAVIGDALGWNAFHRVPLGAHRLCVAGTCIALDRVHRVPLEPMRLRGEASPARLAGPLWTSSVPDNRY